MQEPRLVEAGEQLAALLRRRIGHAQRARHLRLDDRHAGGSRSARPRRRRSRTAPRDGTRPGRRRSTPARARPARRTPARSSRPCTRARAPRRAGSACPSRARAPRAPPRDRPARATPPPARRRPSPRASPSGSVEMHPSSTSAGSSTASSRASPSVYSRRSSCAQCGQYTSRLTTGAWNALYGKPFNVTTSNDSRVELLAPDGRRHRIGQRRRRHPQPDAQRPARRASRARAPCSARAARRRRRGRRPDGRWSSRRGGAGCRQGAAASRPLTAQHAAALERRRQVRLLQVVEDQPAALGEELDRVAPHDAVDLVVVEAGLAHRVGGLAHLQRVRHAPVARRVDDDPLRPDAPAARAPSGARPSSCPGRSRTPPSSRTRARRAR